MCYWWSFIKSWNHVFVSGQTQRTIRTGKKNLSSTWFTTNLNPSAQQSCRIKEREHMDESAARYGKQDRWQWVEIGEIPRPQNEEGHQRTAARTHTPVGFASPTRTRAAGYPLFHYHGPNLEADKFHTFVPFVSQQQSASLPLNCIHRPWVLGYVAPPTDRVLGMFGLRTSS